MKKRVALITAISAAALVTLGGTGIAVASSLPAVGDTALAPAALTLSTHGDGISDDNGNNHDDDSDDHDRDDSGHDGVDDDGLDDGSDDAPDDVVSEADFAAASAAALAAAGSGTVTEVDSSDDGDHAWEVDITLDSGADVEVELDASFVVVRVDND